MDVTPLQIKRSSAASTRSWGSAFDLAPDYSQLTRDKTPTAFVQPECNARPQRPEFDRWTSLGNIRNDNGMHLQTARN